MVQGGDDWLRIIGIKTFLDGGMLTGSAYMRQPWGLSDIYSIRDPEYRGVRFIPKERLVPMVRTAVESGLQFTAHSVGDGLCTPCSRPTRRWTRNGPCEKPPVHQPFEFHEP
jgi:predicted amidohydrolase YtcJ